mgnify:FL=1|jgi:hypothetical protein|tara:strand:+ start:150 stop:380 length:231 start_codon:yes stop_codon:yes gene_type:complete
MDEGVLKLHDLNPDGVRIVVDWGSMVAGSSVFVPCINTTKALEQVRRICVGRFEWQIKAKSCFSGQFMGVRVWRLT